MVRALGISLLLISACGKSASKQDNTKATTPSGEEVIQVPGSKGGPAVGAVEGAGPDDGNVQATGAGAPPNPAFFLKPEEGTLTVDKAEGKAGAESTAKLSVAPAKGYHMATDYPIKLELEPTAGVTLQKAKLEAGGRNKVQGDAETLSEQSLAFAVKATAEKAGTYEIKGTFKFGICEKDSCHPKKQPVTITVAAN
ncbi:MAG TPA: protein-disulfide reductase DsbD domain-containing protein [Kofleriaceae bacterium]|nr:protein-disulfide reductase DsbD domain-containing protein [Kofleriaceae bacterium]